MHAGCPIRFATSVESGDLPSLLDQAWRLHWAHLYTFFRSKGASDPEARECIEVVFGFVVAFWPSLCGKCLSCWIFSTARYTWICRRASLLHAPCKRPSADRERFEVVQHVLCDLDPMDRLIVVASTVERADPQTIVERLEASFNRPFSVEWVLERRHRIRLRILHRLARGTA